MNWWDQFAPLLRVNPPIRRKVFISYFRGDRAEVEALAGYWAGNQNVFIPQIVGAHGQDLIHSGARR